MANDTHEGLIVGTMNHTHTRTNRRDADDMQQLESSVVGWWAPTFQILFIRGRGMTL